jgi:hypothetical protein
MTFRTLILLTVLLLAGCSGEDEPSDPAKLEGAFRGEFNFRPPPGTQIKVKYVWVGDAWVLWMRFTYGEELFKQVIGTNLSAVEMNQPDARSSAASSVFGNPNAPAWWPRSFPDTNRAVFFNSGARSKGTEMQRTYCWKDEKNGWIYWQRDGSQ